MGGEAMALYYADVHRGGERLRQRAGEARRHLPKDLRREMYVEALTLASQGLGYLKIIRELREKYGLAVAKSTISCWVRGIHTPYYRRFPDEERVAAYHAAIRLRAEGLSCRMIAERLSVNPDTVYDWVKGRSSPLGPEPRVAPTPRSRPNTHCYSRRTELRPSPELAYVIGVVLGDGCACRHGDKYMIVLRAKDMEFVEEFARCLSNVIERPVKTRLDKRRGLYHARASCKELYKILKKPVDSERLRPYVEHYQECISAFLRGFFDTEGCVREDGHICVINTDLALLTYVKELLGRLGVETTGIQLHHATGTVFSAPDGNGETRTRRKDVYRLRISKKSNHIFLQRIGLTIHRKRRRLEEHVRRQQKTTKPAPPPLYPTI